jgi:hypothetical protein
MLMIAASTVTLTAFAAGVTALAASLLAAAIRHKTPTPYDPEQAIREITEKVRHPWRYRVNRWFR